MQEQGDEPDMVADDAALEALASVAKTSKRSAPRSPHTVQSPKVDAQGRILGQAFCRNCDKSLEGHTIKDDCKHCSEPVAVSMNVGELRLADPKWLKTLYRGISTLVIGTVFLCIYTAFVSMFINMIADDPSLYGLSPSMTKLLTTILFTLFALAWPGVYIVGTLLLTARRPDQLDPSYAHKSATRARLIFVPALVLEAVALFSIFFASDKFEPVVFSLLILLVVLLRATGFVLLLMHLKYLAVRMPNQSLAKSLNLAIKGLPTLLGCLFLVNVINVFYGELMDRALKVAIGLSFYLFAIGLGIWVLAALGQWRIALTRVIKRKAKIQSER